MIGSPRHGGGPIAAALLASGAVAVSASAAATEWKFGLSGSARATVTSNANLAPSGQERTDLVGTVAPTFRASREGARLKVNATYTPSAFLYLNESGLNTITNSLGALATLEAVEDFFFIDARATASTLFLSPFGAQSVDLPGSSANRSQFWSYGIAPNIRGRLGPTGITYSARSDNFWSTASGSGSGTAYSMTNTARVDSAPARVGWSLEYINRSTRFENSTQNLDNTTYRARLTWNVDPQLRVFATGGYQTNNFALSPQDTSGPLYGGGLDWRPTDRTSLNGFYEQTVFGPNYLASLSHRRPLSAFNISASRNQSTFPQQALFLPPGNTSALLDTILIGRFPDEAQRQAEINRLITTLGLPAFLLGPQSFFSNRVFTVEQVTASAAFIGVRNVFTFTVFTSQSNTVSASVAASGPDPFALGNSVEQQGASVSWNLRVTPLAALNAQVSRTQSETRQPSGVRSTTDRFVVDLTRSLSPKTQGAVGFRYVIFDSTAANDYREAAVFGTISHQF